MAHWTGVEPVTYRLEIGCSIQLSYRCAQSLNIKKSIDSNEFRSELLATTLTTHVNLVNQE